MKTPRNPPPELSAVVVHWRNEAQLAALLAIWPRGPRFELIVVDNSGTAPSLPEWVRRRAPGRNLGFAGGVNLGAGLARAPLLLILNPDAHPLEGALERLLDGFRRYPEAAGLAPALEDAGGASQAAWQLRGLPSPPGLLLHCLFLPPRTRRALPEEGEAVAQPAAAALALRRRVFEEVGGFDERFYPAWFEDVDLARRLARRGERILYYPPARFVHQLGASVGPLGYGPFLWCYSRNLVRYLARHHRRPWSWAARGLVPLGASLRLLALAVRRPRRAASRGEAARGLGAVIAGGWSGWSRPRRYAADLSPPEGGG